MKLIVGLGNPGSQYAQTRHNAGFMAIARYAQRHNLTNPRMRFQSEMLDGQVLGEKLLLLSPLTYMNRSGQAVGEAVHFHKMNPSDVMVIVDDVAIPCGRIRLRQTGSSGGHNGLRDIERMLGTQDYPRLRIGIDLPGRIPQIDYVLGRFTPSQQELLEQSLELACDALDTWLCDGIEKAMTQYNTSS